MLLRRQGIPPYDEHSSAWQAFEKHLRQVLSELQARAQAKKKKKMMGLVQRAINQESSSLDAAAALQAMQTDGDGSTPAPSFAGTFSFGVPVLPPVAKQSDDGSTLANDFATCVTSVAAQVDEVVAARFADGVLADNAIEIAPSKKPRLMCDGLDLLLPPQTKYRCLDAAPTKAPAAYRSLANIPAEPSVEFPVVAPATGHSEGVEALLARVDELARHWSSNAPLLEACIHMRALLRGDLEDEMAAITEEDEI